MSTGERHRALALVYGLACHGLFVFAVALMAMGLLKGMERSIGPFDGAAAAVVNGVLLIQFPLVHSALLTRRGRKVLGALAPADLRSSLSPTTYALVAALQIGLTFGLWSPSGIVLWRPAGIVETIHIGAFAAAWIFLAKALFDAGLGLQTGWIGWTAAWRGRRPRYPDLPETGLFKHCRQPIYLGFALVLWTGPVWTLDHLAIAIAWGAYCAIGPLYKERRFAAIYGTNFEAYRRRVPYLIPRLFS